MGVKAQRRSDCQSGIGRELKLRDDGGVNRLAVNREEGRPASRRRDERADGLVRGERAMARACLGIDALGAAAREGLLELVECGREGHDSGLLVGGGSFVRRCPTN